VVETECPEREPDTAPGNLLVEPRPLPVLALTGDETAEEQAQIVIGWALGIIETNGMTAAQLRALIEWAEGLR